MVTIIDQLPDELLELCFPRDAEWAVFVGNLVCRRWRNLAIESSVCRLTYTMNANNFLAVVSKCPGCIASINAKKFSFWAGTIEFSQFLSSLWQYQPTLRHLDLSFGTMDSFEHHKFPESLISLRLDSFWFDNDRGSLQGCTALESLSLRRSKLTDATELTMLTRLRKLDIGFTPVANPSVLKCLTNLEELGMSFVRHSDYPDVSWIGHLPKLTSLCLASSGLSRVSGSPLHHRPLRLRALDLTFNQISNCSFLADFGASLEFLSLGGNDLIDDLGAVGRYCTNLTELVLYGTAVTSVLPLVNCLCLETLDLSCTPLTDIGPLARLPRLAYLDLVSCCIGSLSPLAACTRLMELSIETCKGYYDLSELAGCRSLLRLSVCVYCREDIEPVLFVPDIRLNGC